MHTKNSIKNIIKVVQSSNPKGIYSVEDFKKKIKKGATFWHISRTPGCKPKACLITNVLVKTISLRKVGVEGGKKLRYICEKFNSANPDCGGVVQKMGFVEDLLVWGGACFLNSFEASAYAVRLESGIKHKENAAAFEKEKSDYAEVMQYLPLVS